MVTVWSKRARAELLKAYLYIQLDSPQNVEMVRDHLIDATIGLAQYPEKHPLDKFKKIMMELGGPLKNTTTGFPTGLWQMRFA
jgi:hypothetical protein